MFRIGLSLPIKPASSLARRATLLFRTSRFPLVFIPNRTNLSPVLRSSRVFTSVAMGSILANTTIQGDLNNTSSLREVKHIAPEAEFSFRSLAITEEDDDPKTRESYRPFILSPHITANDWISKLELSTATRLAEEDFQKTGERLRVLVLYGSLRHRYLDPKYHNKNLDVID